MIIAKVFVVVIRNQKETIANKAHELPKVWCASCGEVKVPAVIMTLQASLFVSPLFRILKHL